MIAADFQANVLVARQIRLQRPGGLFLWNSAARRPSKRLSCPESSHHWALLPHQRRNPVRLKHLKTFDWSEMWFTADLFCEVFLMFVWADVNLTEKAARCCLAAGGQACRRFSLVWEQTQVISAVLGAGATSAKAFQVCLHMKRVSFSGDKRILSC